MKDYTSKVYDMNSFWNVELINNITNKPFTWMKLSKLEFPTKEDAIDYMEETYDAEKDIQVRDMFEKRMKQMPYRMMSEGTDRKKKCVKPKLKKKTKGCKCK